MKKINKFIRILLVLCITMTQFTPLIDVKANDEIQSNIEFVEKNNNYSIEYSSEKEFTGNYYFEVSGKYTYLDNSFESISFNATEISASDLDGYSIPLTNYGFDGKYELTISLYDGDDSLIETFNFEKEITYESGLKITLSSNVIDGVLDIDSSNKVVEATINVLPGGLAPNRVYYVIAEDESETKYTGRELVDLEKNDSDDFSKFLYSTYEYDYNLNIKENDEIKVLSGNLELEYGVLSDNDTFLTDNNTLGMTFENEILYLMPYSLDISEENKLTLENIYEDITTNVYSDREYSYKFFNGEEEITDLTTLVDNDMILEISYKGVTLKYTINFKNDYNKDTYLDENDILPGIEEIITDDETTIEEDANEASELVDEFSDFEEPVGEEVIVSFEGNDQVTVDEELSLTYDISGLEKDVVNVFGAILTYDSEMLEFVSAECDENWVGAFNINNNKILLTSTVGLSSGSILKINFKALKEGNTTVSLENVTLAINNIISAEENNYSVSKDIEILTNSGIGGDTKEENTEEKEIPATPIVNEEKVEEPTNSYVEEELKTNQKVEEKDDKITEDKKTSKKEKTKKSKDEEENESTASKVIIVILIILVIVGLVYLIFKDDDED